jgi:acetyl esterase/lipase
MNDAPLDLDRLVSGDRPSLYVAGMAAAQSLRESGIAVFMVDVLGRVHLLPASFIKVQKKPRLEDEELHRRPEEEALRLLMAQGDDESTIIAYLARRARSTKEF